jgi:di/tricarboxylate transporter
MSPLVIGVAQRLHYEPRPLLFATLMGISAAFITPFAHQANLIVMGPGSYRFGDYFRVGALLTVVVFVVTLLAVPFLWPIR